MARDTLEQLMVGGKRVILRRLGPASDRGLILLHGSGGCHRSFDYLAEFLEGVTCVIPSLPGRLGSEGPPPETVADAARFTSELAQAAGLDSFVVAGHSYGGAVAIELALSARASSDARLAGLVLISTGARLRVHPETLARVERGVRIGSVHARDFMLLHEGAPIDLMDRIADALGETPPESLLADLRASDAFDRMDRIQDITCPTLVLAGERDPLIPPKFARFLAQKINGAELCFVESAGHALPTERPREVAEAIVAFVQRVGKGSGESGL